VRHERAHHRPKKRIFSQVIPSHSKIRVAHFFSLSVEPIFDALSQCSSLHADKTDPNDDGSELDFPVDGDDLELSDAGRVRSDSLNHNRYAPY
jgi:Regulator of volume decrease after cellular swelling